MSVLTGTEQNGGRNDKDQDKVRSKPHGENARG